MFFANPSYLWGLLALLVPLAIHLLNKGDVKTIKVGSVKFLTPQETKQTKNIKLNELLLLLIRMLIITLLVFLLAAPQIKTNLHRSDIIYLVEPSLAESKLLETYLNDLPSDTDIRFLHEGFPEFDENDLVFNGVEQVPNYWELTHGMAELATDSIVVLSRSLVAGMKGMRPIVSANINWVVIDNDEQSNKWIAAAILEEEISLMRMNSNFESTDFETSLLSKTDNNLRIKNDSLEIVLDEGKTIIPLKHQEIISVAIVYEEDFLKEASYFEKAFNAISSYTKIPISVEANLDFSRIDQKNFDVLVWLTEGQIPKMEAKSITYQPDALAVYALEESEMVGNFFLTRRLNVENMLEGKFTKQLLEVLDLGAQVYLNDLRTMPLREIQPTLKEVDGNQKAVQQAELSKVSSRLWLVLVLTIVIERVLAKFRKQ